MTTTIIGLFNSHEDSQCASNKLKIYGFKKSRILGVFYEKQLNSNHFTEKKNFFKNLLGFQFNKKIRNNYTPESTITGVFSSCQEKLEKAKSILQDCGAIHIYEFSNINKQDSKNYALIRKMLSIRAKSLIHNLPTFRTHKEHHNKGILNSEVEIHY